MKTSHVIFFFYLTLALPKAIVRTLYTICITAKTKMKILS